ncbi:alcohol dehydrogenase catalytic domain-containing protein [bacterium]|nr:alcohol dehydrogenase catalytic domain-containing protein [bacterium]
MRAIQLTGIDQMEMTERPDPKIEKDNQVLLRVASIGVCGSDVHYYETGKIGSQVVQYPFVVGHECSAFVEEIGSAVKHLKPGDRVTVDPASFCLECDQCKAGRFHTCRNLTFLGCPGQAEGCLTDFIVMPGRSCYKIPDAMTLDQGALLEPLSIGYYAVKLSEPKPGEKIAILGAGPIGLSVMVCARPLGAAKIYVTDIRAYRAELAAGHGADWAANPEKVDIVEEIRRMEPNGLDTVYECAGQQETIDQAMRMLKPGGKLMLIGIPRSDRISFPIDQARRREVRIQNVRRQNECVEDAMKLVAERQADVDFMITHHFMFEETQKAFDLVEHYEDAVVKAMIHIAG